MHRKPRESVWVVLVKHVIVIANFAKVNALNGARIPNVFKTSSHSGHSTILNHTNVGNKCLFEVNQLLNRVLPRGSELDENEKEGRGTTKLDA